MEEHQEKDPDVSNQQKTNEQRLLITLRLNINIALNLGPSSWMPLSHRERVLLWQLQTRFTKVIKAVSAAAGLKQRSGLVWVQSITS